MIFTASDIIVKAFYLIGEYSPDEQPTGAEMNEALDYLNELLDSFSSTGLMIPFTDEFTFNTQQGQADYTFGPDAGNDFQMQQFRQIMDVYLQYYGVNYPLVEISHDQANQIVRYPAAQSRPTQLFMQKHNTYNKITLYYTPDLSYPIVMRVKYDLQNLTLNTPITSLPRYYRRFLRYILGKELSSVFETGTWDDKKEAELQKMIIDLTPANDLDVSLKLSTALTKKYIGWTKGSIIVG